MRIKRDMTPSDLERERNNKTMIFKPHLKRELSNGRILVLGSDRHQYAIGKFRKMQIHPHSKKEVPAIEWTRYITDLKIKDCYEETVLEVWNDPDPLNCIIPQL